MFLSVSAGGAASCASDVDEDADPLRLLPRALLPALQPHQASGEPGGGACATLAWLLSSTLCTSTINNSFVLNP